MNKASQSVALTPDLRASWQRSQAYGLHTSQALPVDPLNRADLADRVASNARLLTFSRPVIENLLRQIDGTDATVLLTDDQGLILCAHGDTGFLDRSARVALGPGATWSEEAMGTNAIGTALATGDFIAVHGHEHFLERNRFLTCVAIPILSPTGGIAGILDISTDANANLSHANALLRTTAEIIEHRLVESIDEGYLSVRFHKRPELLGSPLEAIAVFDESGQLIACNRNARTLLRIQDTYPHATCEDCFAITWPHLIDWAALDQDMPFPLRVRHDLTLAARASLHSRPSHFHRRAHADLVPRLTSKSDSIDDARAKGVVPPTAATDPRIIGAEARLRRWAERSGPMLIQGEMGTGKHFLARRVWQQHAPGTGFIQTDCRDLAVSPDIESDLADAMQSAGNGALCLSDIDALPIDHQACVFRFASLPGARIIMTSRCTLDTLVKRNRLDMDAFVASHGSEVQVPPLRKRSDFDALVRSFVRSECSDRPMYVCPDALALLRKHRWPGNLSELHNRLRLILALMGDEAGQLCVDDIPEELLEQIGD